jgi:hypothetical protein
MNQLTEKTIEHLRQELAGAEVESKAKNALLDSCNTLLIAEREKCQRLRDALMWYASPRTWNQWCPDSFGDRARAALSDTSEERGAPTDGEMLDWLFGKWNGYNIAGDPIWFLMKTGGTLDAVRDAIRSAMRQEGERNG